jgi:hypothetical protein
MSTTNQPPKIACPHCQAQIKSPALPPGSPVTCPKCGQPFKLGEKPADKRQESGAREERMVRPAASSKAPSVRAHSGSRGPAGGVISSPPPAPQPHRPAAIQPPRHQPPPAPRPAAPPTSDGFVPLDFESAAQVTQPAHRPPGSPDRVPPRSSDKTVDPLVLGPQPRPKPPPPKEVPVVCKLCSTRMYAPIENIGQMIQCPDCHTVNVIRAPKKPPPKPVAPLLDKEPNFGLGPPPERPAYRPIVAPRGEYAELVEFDPSQRPPGWSRPDAPAAIAAAPAAADPDEEDGEEIKVSAPVERIEIKPEMKPLPPPDPEDDLYDGKYDDGLIGDKVDRKAPQAWKKAPLVIGLVGFLFYMNTLPRLIMYAIGLALVMNIGHLAMRFSVSTDPTEKVSSIMLFMFLSVGMGMWVTSFAAVCLAVVQDTANGVDDVQSWPDWNVFDWVMGAMYFPAAAFVAALPGSVFTVSLLSMGLDPTYGRFAAGAPLVISWIFLFPLVLYSMLAEGSIMAPVSAATNKSLHAASAGWMFFYMYSLVIGCAGVWAISLACNPNNYVINSLGSTGVVVLAVLYCRILGRLMWYSSEKMVKLERQQAAASA